MQPGALCRQCDPHAAGPQAAAEAQMAQDSTASRASEDLNEGAIMGREQLDNVVRQHAQLSPQSGDTRQFLKACWHHVHRLGGPGQLAP